MKDFYEHILISCKLMVLTTAGFFAFLSDTVTLDFIITKVLPVLLTLGAGYILLFADNRYVRTADFKEHKKQITEIAEEIAVIKEQRRNTKESLDRIEEHLRELRKGN